MSLVPRDSVDGQGIKTNDFIFKGQQWDLKSIHGNGESTIRDLIKKAKGKSQNFIIDIAKSEMSEIRALDQVKKLYPHTNTLFLVERLLISSIKGNKKAH